MTDFTKTTFITLENLSKYDTLIKKLIKDSDDAVDAKSLKSISVDSTAHKIYFYREAEPIGENVTPAYTIDLSGYDDAISDINDALDLLNGDATKEGSVAKAVKDASDELDGKITALDNKVGEIPTTGEGESAHPVATTVIGYVDAKVAEINGDADALEGRVDDLEDAVDLLNGDDTKEGSVAKAVKDVSDAINATIGTVPADKTVISLIEAAQDKADANEEAIEAINDATTGILQTAKDYTDDLVGAIPLVRDAESGEAVPAADTVVEYFEDKLSTVTSDASTLKGRVDTLVGTDANKSVRTIANEELAAQLLSGKADADFKTLQALAAWLEDHPEEVAEINLNITNLQTLIGTLPTSVKDGETEATPDYADVITMITTLVGNEATRATTAEGGLDTRLQAIETAVGNGGDIDTRIQNAVNALDYTYDGTETDIVVGVSQTDGKIAVQKANLVFATEKQITDLFATE